MIKQVRTLHCEEVEGPQKNKKHIPAPSRDNKLKDRLAAQDSVCSGLPANGANAAHGGLSQHIN